MLVICSKKCGLSKSYGTNWKNGTSPTLDVLITIAKDVYEARILHSDLVASDYGLNNTVIIDEAYTQYMKDLSDILTNLTNEYLN